MSSWPLDRRAPAWWLVAARELHDQWVGGRVFVVVILFSVLLGVMTFLLATNAELKLIPAREMVFLTLQVTIAFALFIGLIISSDSISGERDRATLESLLLAPASRSEIVAGKYLAALSPWPAAYAVSAPFLILLGAGSGIIGPTLLWGALLGTLLVGAFTAFGTLVSFWSSSDRSSLIISLGVFVLFLIPTQFPGAAQSGAVGTLIRRLNPMEATNVFIQNILVNNRTPGEMASWLAAPLIFAVLVLLTLFVYAAPGLRLEAGRAKRIRPPARIMSLLVIAIAGLIGTVQFGAGQSADAGSVSITLDSDYAVMKTGDEIEFGTTVTYTGAELSLPLIVAMNIVNLAGSGTPVDPEDWALVRTQFVDGLQPGESADLKWTVRAILHGDYMVYMAVIPKPDRQEATVRPVVSSGIHLTVTPYTRLNPGGVLPLALGMPFALTLCLVFVRRWRRQAIDTGGSESGRPKKDA